MTPQEFDRRVSEHRGVLVRSAREWARYNEDDAQDLIGEALARAWRFIERFEDRHSRSFRTFLLLALKTSAQHRWVYHRRVCRGIALELETTNRDGKAFVHPGAQAFHQRTQEQQARRLERAQEARLLLSGLVLTDEQQIIVARLLEGKKQIDIAREMEIPQGRVSFLLRTIRNRARRMAADDLRVTETGLNAEQLFALGASRTVYCSAR